MQWSYVYADKALFPAVPPGHSDQTWTVGKPAWNKATGNSCTAKPSEFRVQFYEVLTYLFLTSQQLMVVCIIIINASYYIYKHSI